MRASASDEMLLRVEGLVKHFPVTAGVFGREVARVRAVDGVSFEIARGKTLGLVGESGCGKSTVGRTLLRLEEPTAGRVLYRGRDLAKLSEAELRPLRRELQIVFQDPFGSLNPRMTVADIVGEALEVHGLATGAERERRVIATLDRVGIPAAWRGRYPHEFSGGQRQRISIARAIAPEPSLIVCDEAVSALDVSIQAQVLNLLLELQREMDFAYLFISHDLSVVQHVSDEVAVMYLGQIVEHAPVRALFAQPTHPYTQALLSAIPVPDPRRARRRVVLEGDVPTPLNPPPGCRFHTRCPVAVAACASEVPRRVALRSAGGGSHDVQCLHADGFDDDVAAHASITARSDAALAARSQAEPQRQEPVFRSSPPARRPIKVIPEDETAAVRAWAAGAAAVIAALATFSGWLVTALLALVAAFALRPAAWRLAAGPAALAGAALLIAGTAAGSAYNAYALRRDAQQQWEALSVEIDAYAAAAGGLPEKLSALRWRTVAVLGSSQLDDPWGRRWIYRVPGAEGRPFDLGSYGPDGRLGGGDDVGWPGAARAD